MSEIPAGLGLEVSVIDPSNNDLISCQGISVGSDVSLEVTEPGDYHIQIKDDLDDASSTSPYKMQVSFEQAPDIYEPNNDIASAKAIAFDTDIEATIFPKQDLDYYQVHADGEERLTVLMSQVPQGLGLEVSVFDSSSNTLLRFEPISVGNDVNVSLPQAGDYYIEIKDDWDDVSSTSPYIFSYNLASIWLTSFDITSDIFSPNNDGKKDTVDITAVLSDTTDWVVTIRPQTQPSTTIKTFNGTGTDINITWDGTDNSSEPAADAVYEYVVEALDPAKGISVELKTGTRVRVTEISTGGMLAVRGV